MGKTRQITHNLELLSDPFYTSFTFSSYIQSFLIIFPESFMVKIACTAYCLYLIFFNKCMFNRNSTFCLQISPKIYHRYLLLHSKIVPISIKNYCDISIITSITIVPATARTSTVLIRSTLIADRTIFFLFQQCHLPPFTMEKLRFQFLLGQFTWDFQNS